MKYEPNSTIILRGLFIIGFGMLLCWIVPLAIYGMFGAIFFAVFYFTPIFVLGLCVMVFGTIKIRKRTAIIITASVTILYEPIFWVLFTYTNNLSGAGFS